MNAAPAATTVDTRKAPRRPLKFTCLGCLRRDLNAIEAAHRAGTLGHTGNWTPGQILDHCAITFETGLDGSGIKSPLLARLMGRLFKGMLLKPGFMKPGFKMPADAKELMPRDGVTFEQGMARMRRALARIDAGERMTKPSPWLGPMTHDQWVALGINHCQMHFSFLKLGA